MSKTSPTHSPNIPIEYPKHAQDMLLVIGRVLFVAGCGLLVVGCLMLVNGCWCWFLVVSCLLLAVGIWLLVIVFVVASRLLVIVSC